MIHATVSTTLPSQGPNLSVPFKQVAEYVTTSIRARIKNTFAETQTGALSANVHYEISTEGVEWISDLPYSHVQQFGGFIKASPVTVIRRFVPQAPQSAGAAFHPPIQTYQMARYFWAMFYQTGLQKFKYMALGVNKRGGITVPAHYFMQFGQDDIDYIISTLSNYIISFYSGVK